jgi:PAS domain S-box-containing protein
MNLILKEGKPTLMPSRIIQELQDKIDFYERVLDNVRNGVMITDPKGRVIFFSQAYGNFLGIDPKKVIGKHCREVVENTRMDVVAQTGIPEINDAHRIKGQDMVVQRIPIIKDNRVIAVYGQVMFEDIRDVQALAKKLSFLESKVELYEKELVSLRSSKYTFNHIVGKSTDIGELKKVLRRPKPMLRY